MRINEEQKHALSLLKCERLSSNLDNYRDIESFYNTKNPSLVNTIKNQAFEEDEDKSIAYYVVKDDGDNILMYFSLKCGCLYDNQFNTKLYNELDDLYKELLNEEQTLSSDDEDWIRIHELLEKIRARKGIEKADIARIKRKGKKAEEFVLALFDDNDKVGKTFAGIELVHFCINQNRDSNWKCPNCIQKFGAIVFWKFIVQKVLDAMDIIGCDYLFLFAADPTPDGVLINYYKTVLKFSEPDGIKTLMPLYDLTCKLLYQKTSELEDKRGAFFENFNPDEDAV